MNMIIILAHVWVGQEDREEVCTRPEYRRKESRESVTYFNLKMQLSRNGCRDCLFAYQGGGYKKKKKEKKNQELPWREWTKERMVLAMNFECK